MRQVFCYFWNFVTQEFRYQELCYQQFLPDTICAPMQFGPNTICAPIQFVTRYNLCPIQFVPDTICVRYILCRYKLCRYNLCRYNLFPIQFVPIQFVHEPLFLLGSQPPQIVLKFQYRVWNYIGRNSLLGNSKKTAKFLMSTFTCCSTFLYAIM